MRSLGLEHSVPGGAWRSLVAHLLWEQRVGGSNPSAPTTFLGPDASSWRGSEYSVTETQSYL